jgi:hypothetical protein
MKKALLLFTIFMSLYVKAEMTDKNIYRKVFLYGYVSAFPIFIASDYYWTFPDRNTNGLYISSGFDPKMMISEGMDLRCKVYYHYKRFEPSIIYESFPNKKYESYSFCIDYLITDRKFSCLAGIEHSKIFNYNVKNLHKVNSYGINTEFRLLLKKRWFLSYCANIKTRPELATKKIVYSGYLQLNFKIL